MPDTATGMSAAERAVRRHLHRTAGAWTPVGMAIPRRSQANRDALQALIHTGAIEVAEREVLGRLVLHCRLIEIEPEVFHEVTGEVIGRDLAALEQCRAEQVRRRAEIRTLTAELARAVARSAPPDHIADLATQISGRAGHLQHLLSEEERCGRGLATRRRALHSEER